MEIISVDLTSEKVLQYLDGIPSNAVNAKVTELLEFAIDIISKIETSNDVEFVKKEVDNLILRINQTIDNFEAEFNRKIRNVIEDNFNPDIDNSYLSKTIKYLIDGLNTFNADVKGTVKLLMDNAEKVSTNKLSEVNSQLSIIGEKLNPNDETSYLGVVRKTLIEVQNRIFELTNISNTESFPYLIQKEIQNLSGEESPFVLRMQDELNKVHKNLLEEIVKVREEIAMTAGKSDVMEKTAIKGFAFEQDVEGALNDIAMKYSEIVTNVGGATTGASKKGDFVYEFSNGERLVIECKDSKVGLKPMLKYLNESMDNRDCGYGLLVVKNVDDLPAQVGLMNIYENNKMFCDFNYMEYAIRLLRVYSIVKGENAAEGVDISYIKGEIESIRNVLKSIRSIKSTLTLSEKTVIKNNESVKDVLDEMEGKIAHSLNNIENTMR